MIIELCIPSACSIGCPCALAGDIAGSTLCVGGGWLLTVMTPRFCGLAKAALGIAGSTWGVADVGTCGLGGDT